MKATTTSSIAAAATQPRPLHYDGLALLTTIGKLDLTRAAELAADGWAVLETEPLAKASLLLPGIHSGA